MGALPALGAAQQRSLIVGDWLQAQAIPYSCPVNDICLNVRALVQLANVQVILGPRVPDRLQVRLWYHAQLLPTARYILAIEPTGETGIWEATRVGVVRDGRPLCVTAGALRAVNIQPPADRQNADILCFRERRLRRTR